MKPDKAHENAERRLLSDDELELIAGGDYFDYNCQYCGKTFNRNEAESKEEGGSCGTTSYSYRCPYCQSWNS